MLQPQGVTAVVAGATGLVGLELVRLLLAHPSYSQVITLVRRETNLSHPKLKEILVSFDRLEEELDEELLRNSHVFCALGTTIKNAGSKEAFRKVDYAYPLTLGRVASRSGATCFVIVTAMGSSEKSMAFYNRIKGEIERDLAALALKRLVVLRPSLLLGDRTENRPGERLVIALFRPLRLVMRGPFAKYKAIDSRDVAIAMIETAGNEGPTHEVLESNEISALVAEVRRHYGEL